MGDSAENKKKIPIIFAGADHIRVTRDIIAVRESLDGSYDPVRECNGELNGIESTAPSNSRVLSRLFSLASRATQVERHGLIISAKNDEVKDNSPGN